MPRLQIDVGADLHVKTQAALEALVAANDEREPAVMVRGTELVRMTERGELEALGTDSLCEALSGAASFGKEKDGGWVGQDPPRSVANALLARDSSQYDGLPRVDRVVDVPVLTAGGKLLTRPGHDAGSGLYYRPAEGLEGVAPPDEIGVEDVEAARELLLRDLLGDFEFSDEASRAHALGLLILPFVREYIPGQTPMHGAFGPQPGTGKTYLVKACLSPGCGEVAASPGAGGDDAEWRKVITSALLGGRPALLFDNLHGALGSASLAEAQTTGLWRDRVLGESRMVTLPVRNIWAATGNNPVLSPEQARRTAAIFLDPGDVPPAEREAGAFRHPDLLGWAEANRRELVHAALTLVEHWHRGPATVEGGYVYMRTGDGPRQSRKTLGSFQNWAAVMGGILDACHVPGFLENRDRLTAEAVEEHRDAVEFLAAWHGHTREPLEFREVEALCGLEGPLRDRLPTEVAEGEKKLSYWLRGHAGERAGGYRLLREEDRRHVRRWSVQRRGDETIGAASSQAIVSAS